ncbi:hypothetical protein THF1D04_20477 [Vibrio owensii]|uniref:Uncharacterized protein n=1 Tax=Vibrio owensii TaxID=696485 RepID=A0AAU9Q670_9VIBR|nr:hypothetical protein THF1D04_20477 [Vibrio owensii]
MTLVVWGYSELQDAFARLAFVILESDEGASRESHSQTMLTDYKQSALTEVRALYF